MRTRSLSLLIFVLLSTFALLNYLHYDDRLLHQIATWRDTSKAPTASMDLGRYRAAQQHIALPLANDAEASGLTWHTPSATLFTIAGRPSTLVQFKPNGTVLRQISLPHIADPEGIVALPDGRLALIEERKASLVIFSLPNGDSAELHDALRFDLGAVAPELLHPTNKGPEGLAWDAAQERFIIAKEKPTALYALPFNPNSNCFGELNRLPTGNLFVRDISGLSYDHRTGHLLVLSHNSSLLLELDHAFNPVSFMSFLPLMNGMRTGIRQAEGVAIAPQGDIFVVGEPNLFYQFTPTN